MNLNEIRNEVMGIVSDSSYDPDTVTGHVNQALKLCSSVVDIPEFKRVFTVSTVTDKAYLLLSEYIENFGGRVRRVKYDGIDLTVYPTLEALMDDYGDMENVGDIEAAALEGRTLWYQNIPATSVSLLVLCYVNPEPLSRGTDVPSWLPEHVHRNLLVCGACATIFDQIEEEDSEKPVSRRYEKDFRDGISMLREWIARNRQSHTYGCWRY